jgi:hypothetical protein
MRPQRVVAATFATSIGKDYETPQTDLNRPLVELGLKANAE